MCVRVHVRACVCAACVCVLPICVYIHVGCVYAIYNYTLLKFPTVDRLLSMRVNVTSTVYNGQLGLICCTQGEFPCPHIMLTKLMILGAIYATCT